MKTLAKVVVGSRLHHTANEQSDWDYRGIYIDNLKETLSPFKTHKTTSWIEGDEDSTAYELREFCKLATKGNVTILEVFFSDQVIETSSEHKEMQKNWRKFMDTHAFIQASRGYAHNQYKKALSYDDMGERQQIRTAKFIISFLRVMWQCEQYLFHDEFKCSLETCPYYSFIKQIKGTPREQLNIPECFAKMEEMDKKLLKAEEWCKQNTPKVYNRKPDIEWIEDFLYRVYTAKLTLNEYLLGVEETNKTGVIVSKIYYTSDLHFGNANIIRYENRPWKTVEEMDAGLIANWNQVVGRNDDVYVLGDFCFKGASKAIEYLENLNGRIHLIRGNHDHFIIQKSFELWKWNSDKGEEVAIEGWYKHMKDGEHEVVLCHFPIMYWDGMDDRESTHLYGHMHSRPGMQHPHPRAFNVGVDVNNYRPVTLGELIERGKHEGDN